MDGTTNTWLAILAISSLVQTCMLVGVLVVAMRAVSRVTTELAELRIRQIEPLSVRLHAIADDVQDVVRRVRSVDDEVRTALARGTSGVASAASAARRRVWPAIGIMRGIAAASSFLASRLPRDVRSRTRPGTAGASSGGVGHVRH